MPTKRQKLVFNNAQLAHVWASQTQDQGRNSNGSMYFIGDTIYSYGSHYPIARIYNPEELSPLPDNQLRPNPIVLINNNRYLPTTSQHTSHVESAVSHYDIYYVSDVNNPKVSVNKMIDTALQDAFDLLVQINPFICGLSCDENYRPIVSREIITAAFKNWFKKPNELIDLFNIEMSKPEFDDDTIEVLTDHVLYRNERNEFIERKKRIQLSLRLAKAKWTVKKDKCQKEILDRLEAKERLRLWLSGESAYPYFRRANTDLIRVKGSVIETTGGAEVPLAHGLLALKKLDRGDDITGMRIGHFRVDEVDLDKGLVKIGCHTLNLSQVRHVLRGFSLKDLKAS